MLRDYGYSLKGTRLNGEVTAIKHNRTSVIGSARKIGQDTKLTSSWKVTGTTNGEVFETYVINILIPTLTKGQCVIMDNAKIHKTKNLKTLIEQAGCRLLYLPPYSPDLNPIEHLWSALKNNLRTLNSTKENIQKNLDHCLINMCS